MIKIFFHINNSLFANKKLVCSLTFGNSSIRLSFLWMTKQKFRSIHHLYKSPLNLNNIEKLLN